MEGTRGAESAPHSITEAHRIKLMRNLDKANLARKAKRALREAIKDEEVNDIEVLLGNSPYEELIEEWPVERMLLMMRRIGRGRAVDILDYASIRPHTRLRRLSFAQREHLAQLVTEARTKGGPPL